ncbi:MAG TPA: hypothetical protein VEW42_00210 [Candidatus Eisenbacteria bacterium]|nr:hypothetical protein [Candidatus Eisenbacteria bacterium]
MKWNKWYTVAAVVVVVLLVGIGTWFVLNRSAKKVPAIMDETQNVLTLSPDAIGLSVAFRADNKAMKFTVANANGINSIEYQISYTKNVKDEDVPEGLIGTVDMNPGDKTASIGYREFGTCSSGVCRYDTVVSPVKLTLKVVKSDGKVYQVEKTVSIPQ